MKTLLPLLLALWCPMVSGCGGHSFRHGTVIEKGHADPRTDYVTTNTVVYSGDTPIFIPITTPVTYPDGMAIARRNAERRLFWRLADMQTSKRR